MVKHGHNKKRRAGRIGRTKLKNRSWNRWDPNPKISDPIIKQNWDASRSPAANLQRMGLQARPNQGPAQDKPVSTVIELYDVPDSDRPTLKQRYPLEEKEEKYMADCMARHGDNYRHMFRDTRVNYMQHTEERLRKLGARYLLLTKEQRRVDVPENVRELLPDSMPQRDGSASE